MNTETKLGKIKHISLGLGGYQDAMLGLHVTLGGEGWGVNESKPDWDAELILPHVRSNRTEADRSKSYDEIMRYISKLLQEAKVRDVAALKDIPVEVTLVDNVLESWRILKEVL